MVSHIVRENERQQKYKEERKAKRKPTKDGRMQLKWNIYKRLKKEEFDDPNDDYVASDPTVLEKRGKGVVVSEAKYVKKRLNVKTTSLKRQNKRKKSSKKSGTKRKIPHRISARSSPSSFYFLMCKLNDDQKAEIREMGFVSMLDFEINKIPTVMGYWAVKNFDHKTCTLQVRDASLKVTNKTIHDVLGVPMGGMRIDALKKSRMGDLLTKDFRKQFPTRKKRISFTDVIDKMVKQEKGGRLFKLNFLVLFVTIMAEGIKCGTVNQKFLPGIRNLEDVENMDWCQYILDCLVRTRKEWKPNSHYNGPLVFLVVFYAHSINPKNIGKETLVPVINTWTSGMLMKLEEEEFNTGYVGKSGIQNLAVMESDADDDVPSREPKDRKTSFRGKKRKHDTLESCSTKVFEDANNNKEATENVFDVEGDLDIENDIVGSDDGELNRDNIQNMAEELCTRHIELGVEGLYNIRDGWVLSFGRPKEPTTKEDDDGNEELLDVTIAAKPATTYRHRKSNRLAVKRHNKRKISSKKSGTKDDDGNEELLDHKREQLDENVSPMSDCLGQTIPRKASTSQCCVQGYEVKENIAPILEAIFKKHGDIAAKCVFTIASVRACLLEVVCEVVRRIQANDIIEKMEETESHVSQAEAAKIDVSWLRVHLEAIYKRKDNLKKWSSLMETKVNTVLVQRAAQMDLRERRAEFEEAERCVRVLHLVEKRLNNNILESKAEKDSWGIQPML